MGLLWIWTFTGDPAELANWNEILREEKKKEATFTRQQESLGALTCTSYNIYRTCTRSIFIP